MDWLPVPSLGDVLRSLLPDDNLRSDRYWRAVGVGLLFLGLLFAVSSYAIAIQFNQQFFDLFIFSVLLAAVGIIIAVDSHIKGSKHRDLDKKEKREKIANLEADAKYKDAAADLLRSHNNERASVDDRMAKTHVISALR